MRLVFGQDDLVANWVFVNLGLEVSRPYVAIGGTKDGESLCIGVVFNNFNGSNMDISLFGPGCLTRGNIRAIYQYVFQQMGVQRLTAITRRSNKKMQRLLPRLGFKYEGNSARYFGPLKADDAIRFVLFPEEAEKRIKTYG